MKYRSRLLAPHRSTSLRQGRTRRPLLRIHHIHEALLAQSLAVVVRPATRPVPWEEVLPASSLKRVGYSDDEAFAVGLTCGGIIHLFIQPADESIAPLLDPLDARWLAFGLKRPGAPDAPDAPENTHARATSGRRAK